MTAVHIGIDLGATNMLIGICDDADQLITSIHRPTESHRGVDAVIDTMLDGVKEIMGGQASDQPASIGVAVAGAIDHSTGVVLASGNMAWRHVPLQHILEDRLGISVAIENDANAAAWGEFVRRENASTDDLLAIWVGTGLGAGIVLNGTLFHGPLGTAGELGQTIIEPDLPDGERILEQHVARVGIQRRLAAILPDHPDSMLFEMSGGDPTLIGTKELAKAWHAADILATEILGSAADVIGTAAANTVTLLGVRNVVIGGGITQGLDQSWVDRIAARLRRDVFPPEAANCTIWMTRLGGEAGLVGAANLGRQS
jgi:glucokinase